MKTTEYALLGGFLWMVATGDLKKITRFAKTFRNVHIFFISASYPISYKTNIGWNGKIS